MSIRHPINHIPQFSQRQIYQLLQTKGSRWLKSHVLFADRQIVVVNKPPDFVCQLNHMNTTSKVSVRVVTAFLLNKVNFLSSSTDARPWTAFSKVPTRLMFPFLNPDRIICVEDIKDWIPHSDPHPVHRLDKVRSEPRFAQ